MSHGQPEGSAVVPELHEAASTEKEIIPAPPYCSHHRPATSLTQFFHSFNKHRVLSPHQSLCINVQGLQDKRPQTGALQTTEV